MVAPGVVSLNQRISEISSNLTPEEFHHRKEIGSIILFYILDHNNHACLFTKSATLDAQNGSEFIRNNISLNQAGTSVRAGITEIPFNPVTQQFDLEDGLFALFNTQYANAESFIQFCRQTQCYSNGTCKLRKAYNGGDNNIQFATVLFD